MKKLTLLIVLVGTLAGMSACTTTTRETRSVNTPLGSVSTTTTTVE